MANEERGPATPPDVGCGRTLLTVAAFFQARCAYSHVAEQIDDRVRQSRENARRLRIVSISENDVFDWFTGALSGWLEFGVLALPVYTGLPTDARVLGVHADHMRKTFDFTVLHPSFDPVPECAMIPEFPGPLARERMVVTIPRPDDEPAPAVVVG